MYEMNEMNESCMVSKMVTHTTGFHAKLMKNEMKSLHSIQDGDPYNRMFVKLMYMR